MVTVPSHVEGRQSWILQTPLLAEGHTWQQLKKVKLMETEPYVHFLPIIKQAPGNNKLVLDVGSGDCCFTGCMAESNNNRFVAVDLVDRVGGKR